LEIQSLEAHGDSTSLRVEYVDRDGEKEGAALVDAGVLALGFKLGGTGPAFVLFGADSWFKRKVTAIHDDPQLLSGSDESYGVAGPGGRAFDRPRLVQHDDLESRAHGP
jgi:hypothetical protein